MNAVPQPLAVEAKVMPLRGADRKLIQFVAVEKRFHVAGQWLTAVEGVDLEIASGEVVTLVGPSGCGKSTLLNMAAGMFEPSSGNVLYRGAGVKGLNQKVGYMTQQDHLLPWRSVRDNIGLPLEIKGASRAERKQRVDELVSLVGLSGFEQHYTTQISGGMRKRCALARLLAYDPETLLMDEPFAALDAQMRLALQTELLRISRRLGKTVLFVTHDLDEAIALADRCVVFTGRPGRIAEVIDVDLPRERELTALRFDPRYVQLTQHLWRIMAPQMQADHRREVRP